MSEKKSIYNLSMKEMRGLLLDFGKTLYGKTIFLLAYFLPIMAFLIFCGLVIAAFFVADNLFCYIMGAFISFLILFILGNIYYYHELRIFCEKR